MLLLFCHLSHLLTSFEQEAKQDTGISTDLIMCFLRHEGAEPAWETLQQVCISRAAACTIEHSRIVRL